MTENKLKSIAAPDPSSPDRFIAGTFIDNVGLLVVAARSSAAAFLKHAIETRQYDEAYSTLNGTAVAQGKLFVQDSGGDGLSPQPPKEGAFDIAYQDVAKQLLLNGDWKAQHLSEQEYQRRYDTIDQQYAKDVALLVQQAKQTGTALPLPK